MMLHTRMALPVDRRAPATSANNVIRLLDRHRETAGDRPALRTRARGSSTDDVTFAELAERVESAAAGLARLGVKAGDRVFLFVPMSVSLYVGMFAVQRLGAIAVFLDSWARRDELGACAARVGPRAVIAPERALAAIREDPRFASVDVEVSIGGECGGTSLEELACSGARCPVAPVAPDRTALVTFTTGSSGAPKGADRTHGFLAAQHRALWRTLPYRDDDVDLSVFPIFALNNLAGGVTTVLPAVDLAEPRPDDGDVLLDQMIATGTTTCTLSPSLLRATTTAARSRGLRLDGIRRCTTGGAPIGRDDVSAFESVAPGAEVHVLYGSTEVEPIAHAVPSREGPPEGPDGVCVGRIVPELDHRLVRLTRRAIELGRDGWRAWDVGSADAGELVVAGDHVCPGYYRDDEAFRRTKIRDADGRVWHRTGDVGRIDSRGRLWIAGRVHNAIDRGGEILFPVRAELLMKGLPFVAGAAYLGLPDPRRGERACAVFTLRPGHAGESTGEVVRSTLTRAGIPVDEVRCVSSLPLDARHHSKVRYDALRDSLLREARS